jgi:hypothetical protein
MEELMGRAIKSDTALRCDFCGRPVRFGYRVNEGPTHGFFHSKECLQKATEHMAKGKGEQHADETD